jgi:hypothetical protein
VDVLFKLHSTKLLMPPPKKEPHKHIEGLLIFLKEIKCINLTPRMTEVGKKNWRVENMTGCQLLPSCGAHRGWLREMNGMWLSAEQVGDRWMCTFRQWWNESNGETRSSLTENCYSAILFIATHFICCGLGLNPDVHRKKSANKQLSALSISPRRLCW